MREKLIETVLPDNILQYIIYTSIHFSAYKLKMIDTYDKNRYDMNDKPQIGIKNNPYFC